MKGTGWIAAYTFLSHATAYAGNGMSVSPGVLISVQWGIILALFILLILGYGKIKKLLRQHIQVSDSFEKQQTLVEQRNQLEKLFHTLREGIVTLDRDGTVTFINLQALHQLHLPEAGPSNRYKGVHYSTLFVPEYKGEDIFLGVVDKLSSAAQDTQFPHELFIRQTVTGNSFLAQTQILGIYKEGQLAQVIFSFRDTTQEQIQHYFLNLVLATTHVFPWFFDLDRMVFFMEPTYFDYLGIPNDHNNELSADTFRELIHPDDREAIFCAFGQQMAGHLYTAPVSYRLLRGDGSYEWFEGRSTYLGEQATATNGIPYRIVGICMSIQKSKEKDDELEATRRSNQLKSAFLANMSHEIRTPLNAIVGFANLLAEQHQELGEGEVQEFASIINKNSDLLLALINDILDLSKIESGSIDFHYSKENIRSILQDIYDSQRLNMPPGVALKMDAPDQDKTIRTDPVRFKQVLNNLINNAAKFTASGSITFGYREEEEGYTTFFVADTGKGISAAGRQHIFERFYKDDHFTQGAGLGLSICQSIVDRFQGEIAFTSQKGKGTCFTVKIPDDLDASQTTG